MAPNKTKRLATMFSVIFINSPRPNLGAKAGPGRCDYSCTYYREGTSREIFCPPTPPVFWTISRRYRQFQMLSTGYD
jgi:hypothetical protein